MNPEKRFRRGDVVVIFREDCPDNVHETEVVAVSAAKYGTPKIKLKGDEKFEWYASGTEVGYGRRRLVAKEDLPAAQEAARLRLARNALAREIETLFETAAHDARRALGGWSDPDLGCVMGVAIKLRTDLDGLLAKAAALKADP